MDLFSDNNEVKTIQEFTPQLYNDIIDFIKSYYDCLFDKFPDYKLVFERKFVIGSDYNEINKYVKLQIPNFCESSYSFYDEEDNKYLYVLLDYSELIVKDISDYQRKEYNNKYDHFFYLEKQKTTIKKKEFIEELNRIFRVNHLDFFLNNKGKIESLIPENIKPITNIMFKNSDMNQMYIFFLEKFKNPHFEERIVGLKKIWELFERIKTEYDKDKKKSIQELINKISEFSKIPEELLDDEFIKLTYIGNSFQIRHFGKEKIAIETKEMLEYFAYRMITLINLISKSMDL